ncbi:GTPase IMAP family member 9-like [Engraulis encrasicolus]|uniref:GTPase IMAP family member 9-like n=1 Tax=Engraulis encrasicolus TaxID=184585 RepID=UPI002FD4E0F1
MLNAADIESVTMAANPVNPMRLVIFGKTGVGKSHVGNVIVRREGAFVSKCSASSVTQKCSKQEVIEDGRRIEVVDTPGIMDTGRPAVEVANEILQCIQVSSPGPHAFLLVIQLTRFTDEEQKTVKDLQGIFGRRLADYMIVVFNRADELGNQTIQQFLQDGTNELRKVISECGGRYVPFYNDLNNREQVADLVRMVDQMIVVNGGEHFSNEVYEDSVRNPESFVGNWLSRMIQWVKRIFGLF